MNTHDVPHAELDPALRGELTAQLRALSACVPALGLAPADQWDLHARLATARAQLAAPAPSRLLLRIALMSVHRRLREATASETAGRFAPGVHEAIRRLPM